MPLRWQEVALPLAMVLVLVLLKHVPGTQGFPFSRLAGIVAFGYAIFLSLRLIQGEEGVFVDGWSELRPSPVELFSAFGGASLSGVLLVAVLFGNMLSASPLQMSAALSLSVVLAVFSGLIVFTSLLVRIRWNQSVVERQDHRGRKVAIAWDDVVKVEGRWGGVTIYGREKQKLKFSPLHSGAAQLAKLADSKAQRNAASFAAEGPVLWR
jgi:hypothetical protein